MVWLEDLLGGLISSRTFDFDVLWLAVLDGASFSLCRLDLVGVSGLADLFDDLLPSPFFARALEDFGDSVLIFILDLSSFCLPLGVFVSLSPTVLSFRDGGWSTPVNGGLGGAWWFSVR